LEEEAKGKGGSRLFPFREMRNYTIIWIGQVVSFVGSGMTMFALVVRAYELTGEATASALVFFFAYAPTVMLSPLAGAVVDRFSRKTLMILTDLGSALSTVGILSLFLLGNLELWHVYGLLMISGGFRAFQWPALSAATTVLVPKKHLGRASGMLSTAWALSEMLSPIMAAVLLGTVGLTAILMADLATFLVAVVTLMVVHIPSPPESKEGKDAKGSWKKDITFGFHYIFARKGLMGLLTIFFTLNFILTIGWVLFQPMILAKTGNNELVLGTVLSVGGIGGILGGLIMTLWGGPKRRVYGVLIGLFVISSGIVVIGIGNWAVPWALGIFVITLTDPIIMGSSQSIWQCKVPPDVQGRVFSARMFMALVGEGPAMLLAGPLADWVFEPAMTDATGVMGAIFGGGAGAGMAVIITLTGVLGIIVSVLAYFSRSIRNVEDILPDHDEVGAEEGSEEAAQEGACGPEEGGALVEEGTDELGGEVDVPLPHDDVE
jgi:MFS family permease